jgi:acetyltransferase-like isoleucine patch superfamily enzyme
MLLTIRRFIFNPISDFLPASCFGFRKFILRIMGVKIDKTARINSGFRIYGSGKLIIEKNVWVGRNCHFYTIGNSKITIGCSSEIGPECSFNCQSHKIGDSFDRAGPCIIHDITIGNGTWIGMRSTILCNNIGSGCVIGAGSVVLNNTNNNTLYAGIPAKCKKIYN